MNDFLTTSGERLFDVDVCTFRDKLHRAESRASLTPNRSLRSMKMKLSHAETNSHDKHVR